MTVDIVHPVQIVGAGPGDPELLTVKAVRALQQADVVVYDKLVSAEILSFIPAGATRIFAGRVCAQPPYAAAGDQRTLGELGEQRPAWCG